MRLMRVHADRKPRTGELRGHPFRLRLFGRVAGGKDAEDMCDPRLPSAREHVVQVGREHRIGEMAVRIDHRSRITTLHDAHTADTVLTDGPMSSTTPVNSWPNVVPTRVSAIKP